MKLALCVATILLVIGMPVAYWLAYSNWRGKFLLESLVALRWCFRRRCWDFTRSWPWAARAAGKTVDRDLRPRLAFTFGGLILASVLYSFPFAVQPLIASFEGSIENCWRFGSAGAEACGHFAG